MAVPSSKNRKDHVIASATTDYDYDFRIFANSNLVVISRSSAGVETTLVLDTDYTVAGAGNQNGGTITLSPAYLAAHDGEALAIIRVIPTTQNTSIRNQGKFYPETHEDVFDRLAMVDMQLDEESSRTVRMPVTVSSDMFAPTLPSGLVGSAGMTVIVNEDGDGFDVGPTAAQISSAQSAATTAIAAKNDAVSAADNAEDLAEASEASAIRSEAAAIAAEAVGGVATQVHAAVEKTTLADDDEIGGTDSEDSFSLVRWKWSSLVTALNSLYATFAQGAKADTALQPAAIGTTVLGYVAPGTIGNVLIDNGTAWVSAAPASTDSMTLLGTLTTTDGATQTLSGLTLTSYRKLYIEFTGVSSTSAASININSSPATNATPAAADTLTGQGTISLGNSSYLGFAASGASDTTDAIVFIKDTGITTASTSITFTASAGTFDAGTIKVYGEE